MTEENKDPQVEPEKVATEEVIPQEPTIEELKEQVTGLTAEKDRKETEIQRLQGITRDLQKRGVPKEELEALTKRLDGVEESSATMMDYLESHLGEGEDIKPTRKTHRQELDEKRQAKPEAPVHPDAQKFLNYLDSQGLGYDDPLVLEAVAEDRTPQEALKYLKGKTEETSQVKIDKRAEEIAKNLLEQELKKLGLTASGAETPSASAKDISSMTADEKLQEGFKQIKKK